MSAAEAKSWGRSIVAPVIVAVLVGMGTAYLTATTTIAVMGERITAIENRIDKQEASASTQLKELDARSQGSRERLIRLETKIDVLLSMRQ